MKVKSSDVAKYGIRNVDNIHPSLASEIGNFLKLHALIANLYYHENRCIVAAETRNAVFKPLQ